MNKILCVLSLLFIVGCNNKYNDGIKLLNENKYRDAITVLKEVEPNNNNYSEAQMNIYYAEYLLSVNLIKENKLDSAIIELSNINKNSSNYNKSQSAINYCKALKSLERKDKTEALNLLSKVNSESEFYEDATIKTSEIKKTLNITFRDFAKTFIEKAFSSPEMLSNYSEETILTSSILGNFNSTAFKEFKALIDNRKFYKKHKIKDSQIYMYCIITDYDPKGSEQGMQLHFKSYIDSQTGTKTWKLFKIIYEGC